MTDLFRAVVIVVAVGLAGLILACEDDPETPPTVTPTASLPSAEFPSGVEDFARTLDRAFSQGEIGLSKFTQYGDWSCPNNYFPAAGPNCVEAADGEGVKAIVIGAYASEGDIYDGPSYGRYLSDWIYDALRDSSDEYGDGAPRVYALADMREEFEGEQGELGNYEIVATRIAESPVDRRAAKKAARRWAFTT